MKHSPTPAAVGKTDTDILGRAILVNHVLEDFVPSETEARGEVIKGEYYF